MTSQVRERRWHYRRSLASRVILLTTLAVGLALAAVALGAYVTVRTQMMAALDESLLDRAEGAAQTPTLSQITANYEVPSWALGAADVRIYFLSSNGRARSADQGPELPIGSPELTVARGEADHSLRTVWADGVPYRVVATPTAIRGQALVLAQSMEPQMATLRKLGAAMLIFGIAGVVAAALAGWGVATNGLRPVRRLTRDVERIARTSQLTPLRVEGADEVARLSVAFNQLLAAVAASQQRQRQLVADASHELRTPLTSLRTNLDLLAQADSALTPEERRELLDDVQAQIEELTTLIGDLVELARDEQVAAVVESVDLADVVERSVARVRRRAPSLHFDVVTEPWPVQGEDGALERAVTNLLDNAAKWSPPDGTVGVRLLEGTLVVDDEGPGIPPADLPHVFERFYRSSESRTMPGSGLGLSIVHQVAVRHGGTVTAGDGPLGGARFTLTLPHEPDRADHAPAGAEALVDRG
jgi:two-component system sensor histidine kinase MprB